MEDTKDGIDVSGTSIIESPESEIKQLPQNRTSTHPKLRTVSGHATKTFALGGNREVWQRNNVPPEAFKRGVNYFFAYSMDDDQIGAYLDGLKELCKNPATRKKIFVAVGMEDFSNKEMVTEHIEKCLHRLGTDYVDAFFLEYVCRGDEDAADETMQWMRGEGGLVVADGGKCGIDGPVRFVGCSTHDRCVGVNLLRRERSATGGGGDDAFDDASPSDVITSLTQELTSSAIDLREETEDLAAEFQNSKPCSMDLLMARYNMAHTKAEWRLFPVAEARDVPVVAFTSTRWNSLQKGHPRWTEEPPTTAKCVQFAANHPAVQVVLNSAVDVETLSECCDELSEDALEKMSPKEMDKWREYGELVYDESAEFETLF